MNKFWLFEKHPRAKKSCDYCGTDKLGLGVRSNYHNTFCGPNCQAWYEHCLYQPPDELLALLCYPP
jgi:hypothetical protein